MSIELTDEQKELKRGIIHWYNNFPHGKPYYYYSGAAGTGKTTVMQSIVNDLGLRFNQYITCAYTGKAVLVLLRKGLPSQTLHSLIYDVRTSNSYDIELDEWGNPHKVKKCKTGFVLKDHISKDIKLIFLDERAMVNDKMLNDLQSFGVPIIMAGDQNQLPPVFGTASDLDCPDFVLTQIMRQEQDNPIVYLSQCVLNDMPIQYGQYKMSNVVKSVNIDKNVIDNYDIILCPKNKTRDNINDIIRNDVLGYEERKPVIGDKVICRRNNRDEELDGIYLTNGLVGTLTDVNYCSMHRDVIYANFKPDFMEEQFEKLSLDYKYLRSDYSLRKEYDYDWNSDNKLNLFEYAYAITVHLSQGSEYSRVLFMDEKYGGGEMLKRLRYTAITRARDMITWVKQEDKKRSFYTYYGNTYNLND